MVYFKSPLFQPEDYRLAEIVDAEGEIRDVPPAPPQKQEPDGKYRRHYFNFSLMLSLSVSLPKALHLSPRTFFLLKSFPESSFLSIISKN